MNLYKNKNICKYTVKCCFQYNLKSCLKTMYSVNKQIFCYGYKNKSCTSTTLIVLLHKLYCVPTRFEPQTLGSSVRCANH